eukprot:637869-Pelagomonas_calceolata.AAC.8
MVWQQNFSQLHHARRPGTDAEVLTKGVCQFKGTRSDEGVQPTKEGLRSAALKWRKAERGHCQLQTLGIRPNLSAAIPKQLGRSKESKNSHKAYYSHSIIVKHTRILSQSILREGKNLKTTRSRADSINTNRADNRKLEEKTKKEVSAAPARVVGHLAGHAVKPAAPDAVRKWLDTQYICNTSGDAPPRQAHLCCRALLLCLPGNL